MFQLQTLFEEICEFLTKAGIDVKGLFLNADTGFDSKEFRVVCEQKEIMANIPHNPRNEKEVESTDYQYSDEESTKKLNPKQLQFLTYTKPIVQALPLNQITICKRYKSETPYPHF